MLERIARRRGLELVPADGRPAPRGRAAAALARSGWHLRPVPPPDFDAALVDTIERVAPYTATSPERIAALVRAVEHVVAAGLPGALVECGVWRGGSAMAMALTLRRLGVEDRDLVLFDTFSGMTTPTDADVETDGVVRAGRRRRPTHDEIQAWSSVGIDEVRANLHSTGYPPERVRLMAGPVEETLPAAAPEELALLRLDTDWYASTAHELRHLYPRLRRGGILIVDDYGHWDGARRAVDEFFADAPPFLHRVDYTARLVVKP